jgi:hypothetical protein
MKNPTILPKILAALSGAGVFVATWWLLASDSCLDLGGAVDAARLRCNFGDGRVLTLLAALPPLRTLVLACFFGLVPYAIVNRCLSGKWT